jgi:hypothetical protein
LTGARKTSPSSGRERARRIEAQDHLGEIAHQKETVEGIGSDAPFDLDVRLTAQGQLAGELLPGIAPHRAAVTQVVMALREALCVVAKLMLPQQSERPGDAHLHAQIDQQVFEPARTLEAVVHQLSMTAEGVAQQQHETRGRQEQAKRRHAERLQSADDRGTRHAEEPRAIRPAEADLPFTYRPHFAMSHAEPAQPRGQRRGPGSHALLSFALRRAKARDSRLSGPATGQTSKAKPVNVLTRLSGTIEYNTR